MARQVRRIARKGTSTPGQTSGSIEATGIAAAASMGSKPSSASKTGLVLRIPRQLHSPNFWNGMHWRAKHRLTKGWENDLWIVSMLPESGGKPATTRQRLQVTREVPSTRHFIRDTDNLYGACKPLSDALKRLGLIVDDSVAWLELAKPEQCVSADGGFWTVIELQGV
jgi:hypothetical protein